MNTKMTSGQLAPMPDTDDIEQFLAEHHDAVAAKLAAGREQIVYGEVASLEPLGVLLRQGRSGR